MSGEVPKLPAGRIFAGRYAVQRPLDPGRGTARHLALGEPNGEVLLEVFPCPAEARGSVLAWLGEVRARLADASARHVVPILDHGVDETTGLCFVASAWPVEPPLAELVSVCAMTSEETVQLARALAASLGTVHRAGLAHLGLDTRTVFVPPLAKGNVVLSGVGVARAVALAGGRPWGASDPEELPRGGGDPSSDVFMAAGLLATAAGSSELEGGAEVLPGPMAAVLARGRSRLAPARFGSPEELAEALDAAASGRAPISRTMPVPAPSSSPEIVAPPPSRPEVVAAPPPPSRPEVVAAPPAAPVAAALEASVSPFSLGESSGRLPMESEPPPPPRRSRALVGVVGGVLAVAAAAVVVLVLRGGSSKRITSDTMASRAAPSASAVVPGAAAAPPPAAPSATPVPEPPPPSAPEPAPLGPEEAELTVTCTPECDKVLLNGKPIASPTEPVRVKAGTYGVGVGRAGHGGQWRKIVLPRGTRQTVEFTLTPVRGGGSGAAAPARPKANCGKFLKRCD